MNSITLRRVLVFSAAMLLLVATAQPVSATTLAYDSFTRPDNTDLNANRSGVDLIAPTNWIEDAGNGGVVSNAVRTFVGGVTSWRARNTTVAFTDGFVGADVRDNTTVGNNGTRIEARSKTDGSDTGYEASISVPSDLLALTKTTNGVQTILATVTGVGLLKNVTYRMVLEVTGSTLKLYVDGVLKLSATDSEFTTGQTSFQMDGGQNDFPLDNFKVATTFEEANDPNPPLPTVNHPPDTSQARPSVALLWPPNHKLVPIFILDVTDPDGDPVSITITGIRQDEPVNGLGDGDTSPDGQGVGTPIAQVRAERAGQGDGRVYTITFEACDDRGGCSPGAVTVGVPLNQGKGRIPVNDGPLFDSTQP